MDCLRPLARELAATPQDPLWHGEGDVLTHTRAVYHALDTIPEYRSADPDTQKVLRLAAAFHDVGKIPTTRQEDGRWVSPGHGRVGSQMTRRILWLDHALCGAVPAQGLRESVCALIRCHSLPLHALEEPEGERRLLRFAAQGSLAPWATVRNLCILAQADILGRVCPDAQELLEKVALCKELAREANCLDRPYPFPSDHTRFAFLSGREVPRDYPLYDDTWGQVILMSGLPGTGKDTWIREHCPELPMVSLDDIRRELSISPLDNQTPVLDAARDRAKGYLRRHIPFLWNATDLSPQVRSKQISLFTSYGASVRVVYLETTWAEQLRRNSSRGAAVPEDALFRMLDTLTPPEPWEAHRVDWLCL